MIRMIAARLASSSLSIVILVTLVFFMAHLTPGGPAYSILGMKATASSVAQLNARLGLNEPLWRQYAVWWWHLLHGQLGYSYLLNRPVGQLLWRYELNTLVFYSVSIIVSTALSIGIGLLQGVYDGRWPARLIGALQLLLTRTFIGRAIMAVAQDQLALKLMGVDPIRIKRIAFGISIATASLAGAFLIIIQPVEPSVGREYIGRVFAICVLGGMGSLPGTLVAAMLIGIVESITSTFYGPSWAPAVSFGFLLLTLAVRPAGLLGR